MRRDSGWREFWRGFSAAPWNWLDSVAVFAVALWLLWLTGCALRDLATPPRPLYPPCADSAATRDSTTGRCRASADTTEARS